MDGCDALQDEAAEKRRHRDGLARPRLQHDPRDQDHGHPSTGCHDEGPIGGGLARKQKQNASERGQNDLHIKSDATLSIIWPNLIQTPKHRSNLKSSKSIHSASPRPVNCGPEHCCAMNQWRLYLPPRCVEDRATAVIFMLQARAAKKLNSQDGLFAIIGSGAACDLLCRLAS